MGIKSSRYGQHNSLTQVIQHPSSPEITTIELSLSTSSLVGFKPHIFLHSFSSHHTVQNYMYIRVYFSSKINIHVYP